MLAEHCDEWLSSLPNQQGPDWNGRVEVFSWKPRAFRLRNFLTDAECDFLIEQVWKLKQSSRCYLPCRHIEVTLAGRC